MSDLTQDHPEFFKAPSEHDSPPKPDNPSLVADPATALSDDSRDTLDDLLGEAQFPLLLDANLPVLSRNNRTAAGLISVLGGVIFALLFAAAAFGVISLRQNPVAVVSSTVSFLATPIYWLTVVIFTAAFALLTVILSRGAWVSFVVGSFFVGAVTYLSALGAGLIAIHAWELTFAEAKAMLWDSIAFSPLILIAPILGREIPLWLGVWISRRGKRLRDEAAALLVKQQ